MNLSFFRIICCCLLLCWAGLVEAAMAEGRDSLLELAASYSSAEEGVDSLNEWAWNMRQGQPNVALQLAQEALKISKERNYVGGQIDAYKRIGTVCCQIGDPTRALMAYQCALPLLKETDNEPGMALVLGNIGNVYLGQHEFAQARNYYRQALAINLAFGENTGVIQQYHGIGICHEQEQALDSAIFYYQRAMQAALQIKSPHERLLKLAMCWQNLGGPYQLRGQLDSAAYYWGQSQAAFAQLQDDYGLANILNNLGLLAQDYKQPQRAIDSCYMPALRLAVASQDPEQRKDILRNLALAHEQAGHIDSALAYWKTYQAIHDTLFNDQKSEAIAEIETRYQVAETQHQNQLLLSEGKRKTVIVSAISTIALLVASIAVLAAYSQRKRNRIQQELNQRRQQQDALRIVELVQGQELRALEAMVEGQERERGRLATDLHDNLGSLLATVKLYFNQLHGAGRELQEPFRKADQLIDEACQEVRRYSHDLMGLPVVQFGLVNALKDLADSISGAGKLQVRVYAHHIDTRLPVPIERSLYKMIQELLTNVIKHAQATEATIQLSRLDAHLNIMLEDNGRGMDVKKAALAPGWGMRSIQARVEAMGGECTFDSNLGHGTTVLIDIPWKEAAHD